MERELEGREAGCMEGNEERSWGGGGGVTPHTCTCVCVENRKRRTVGSDVCTLSIN